MYNMIKPLFYILILGGILVSCKPDKEEDVVMPSYLLSEEQLVNVLTDAYLSEGASGINVKNVIGVIIVIAGTIIVNSEDE